MFLIDNLKCFRVTKDIKGLMMEPMEFIKTGEYGTSFVLNEAAIELLQNVKKPLVGQNRLIKGLLFFFLGCRKCCWNVQDGQVLPSQPINGSLRWFSSWCYCPG